MAKVRLAEGIEAWAQGEDFLYATDLLEYLVQRRVPFREAHEAVAKLVRYAIDEKSNLRGLSLEEFQRFSRKFDGRVYQLFDPRTSVNRKKTPGSTQPAEARKWLLFWKKKLKKA